MNKIMTLLLLCMFAVPAAARAFEQNKQDQGDGPVILTPSSVSAVVDMIDIKQMDIHDVLKLISKKSGRNIVASQGINGRVSLYLNNTEINEVLFTLTDAYGWALDEEGEIIKVMTAEEYEKKYGIPYGKKLKTKMFRLTYVKAVDVQAVLNQVKSNKGKVIMDEKSGMLILVDHADKVQEMEDIIGRMDVPTTIKVFDLNYAKALDISPKIAEVLTPALGSMKFDERSNRIIVSDTQHKLDEVGQIIAAFDYKDREVLVDAKIIQIVLSDEYKLGVDWEAFVDDYHSLNFAGDFDVLSASDKRGRLGIGTLASDRYTATVEALETIGTTEILSSPSIATLNNKEAKILVGSTEPYVTTTTTTPASGPTTTAESVNFIEVGVKLYVTPTIHNDNFITMKIKPEVSSVTSSLTTSNNNTIPIVETSEAETTVMVKDRVTIVIGGLIKEETVKTDRQIPVLGDIPLLGKVFKSTNDSKTKTETVIFLTPKIITGEADNLAEGNKTQLSNHLF